MKGRVKGFRVGRTVRESGHCGGTVAVRGHRECVAVERLWKSVCKREAGGFPTEQHATATSPLVCTFPRLASVILPRLCIPIGC